MMMVNDYGMTLALGIWELGLESAYDNQKKSNIP